MAETATVTRERPILFSAEMVRAILDNRKSMTRRIVKFNHKPWPQPLPHVEYARDGMPIWFDAPASESIRQSDYFDNGYPCPYGQTGDRLWVRESFAIESFGAGVAQIRYAADGKRGKNAGISDRKLPNRCGSVPSIHMPRHASRLTLELTGVRVERVQDISEDDAQAEGADIIGPDGDHWSNYREAFEYLWNKVNGPGAWDRNDWTWALSFRKIYPRPQQRP